MEASFCVEALEDALAHHGKPEIVNTDQGSQFTGSAFTMRPHEAKYRGQHGWQRRLAGQCLCRAVMAHHQYEEVYLRTYDSVSDARTSIGRYYSTYRSGILFR